MQPSTPTHRPVGKTFKNAIFTGENCWLSKIRIDSKSIRIVSSKFEIRGEDEVIQIAIAEARYTGHFGHMPLGHSLSKHQGDVKEHSVHSR
jgi:hypothetical protein